MKSLSSLALTSLLVQALWYLPETALACTPVISTVRFLPTNMNATNSMTLGVQSNGGISGSVQSQCLVAGNTYEACGVDNAWCISYVCLGTDVRLTMLTYSSAQAPFPPNPNTFTITPDGYLSYAYNSCV